MWRYGLIRLGLGLVLLVAAVLKGYQLATEPVLGERILDARWLLVAVVEFEFVFGVWLLAGNRPRATWSVAVACFTVFALVSAYKALNGEESCGCFGRVAVSPWYTLALDVGALAGLMLARPQPIYNDSAGLFSVAEFSIFAGLFVIPSALLMGGFRPASLRTDGSVVGDSGIVLLEPQDWVGGRFPLLRYVDIGTELATGDWKVVLYRHDCSKCHALIDQYRRTSRGTSVGRYRIALIEIPPFASPHNQPSLPGARYGRLATSHDWFVSTPTVLEVSDGKVLSYGKRDVELVDRESDTLPYSMRLRWLCRRTAGRQSRAHQYGTLRTDRNRRLDPSNCAMTDAS